MAGRFLFLVLLLFPLFGVGQDIIFTHDSTRIDAKVLEISSTHIRYKEHDNLNGPTFVLERALVYKIRYPNGKESILGNVKTDAASTTGPGYVQETKAKPGAPPEIDYKNRTAAERAASFEAGQEDASLYYTGSGPMVGTMMATLFGAGIIGLVAGGIAFATPPDVDMYPVSNNALRKDPDFRAGYQKEAHKKKKKKVATGFVIGLGTFVLLVAASSN